MDVEHPVALVDAVDRGHGCIWTEGGAGEYRGGDWSHVKGRENGSKMPIVDAI
jgi:hypothetical protein